MLAEFLRLSPPSQAVVVLVLGSAAALVLRLVLRVIKLVLALLRALVPKRALRQKSDEGEIRYEVKTRLQQLLVALALSTDSRCRCRPVFTTCCP